MSILVIGSNGLLGSNVIATAKVYGFDVVGTYHSTKPQFETELEQLDIRNTNRFRQLVHEYQPTTVINCAAMTDVDDCESNSVHAFAINAEAPARIASVCKESGVQLVHISTDYIFDGMTSGLYSERHEPNPQQIYGKSKLAGEQAVRAIRPELLVIRPSFIYGIHRSLDELAGFPAWVSEQLTNRELVPLFTDQHITPSRAGGTAETLLTLMRNNISGVVHVASQSCVTPYEFGRLICERTGSSEELLAESSMGDVDRLAVRPKQTCLDTSRVERLLDQSQPTLEEDLSKVDNYLY